MIEGEHVRLRKLERGDLPTLHRWFNDAELMSWARVSPDHMVSVSALEKEYERELAGEDRERTTFILEEKATSKPIGSCVMRMWEPKHLTADLGIMVNQEYRGKGYGTEAMQLLLTIVFDHQGFHRASLITRVDNERAIRSFEKCGFRRAGVAREGAYANGQYYDGLHMDVLKSEWDARKASH